MKEFDDHADMGVGTIVIFIAILLGSAVAANMLIQSTYLLQQQAQRTGAEAMTDVSTGMVVISVLGDRNIHGISGQYYNVSDPLGPVYDDANKTATLQDSIQVLMLQVKLAPGSPEISMDEVMISITDGDEYVNLNFKDVTADHAYNATATEFTADALTDNKGWWASQRVLSQQSILKIYIDAGEAGLNFTAETPGDIFIVPKYGSKTYEDFMTPGLYIERLMVLP